MNFFVRLALERAAPASSLSFDEISSMTAGLNTICLTGSDMSIRKDIIFGSGHAVFIGDPVFHNDTPGRLESDLEHCMIDTVIRNTDGFYYLLVIYHHEQKLIISSGNFSIMPVFYSRKGNVLLVSSSFNILVSHETGIAGTADRQYYLEKALFNYPLFNRTPLREISLLPSNSLMEYCDSTFSVRKHTTIYDFFTSSPGKWKQAEDELSDLFIEKAGHFIPDSSCILSLTGGLDSRCVAGIATARGKISGAFTYGQSGDHDVTIASEIARSSGIRFDPVILDEHYARDQFWHNGIGFMKKSYGLGNMSRAHYNFILENHLQGNRYLLSGNFGSEILRSVRMAGVVTSGALFRSFSPVSEGDLINARDAEQSMKYINPAIVSEHLQHVIEEITDYIDRLPSGLTANQKLYVYIFEEVLRKYFGAEILCQSGTVRHRAPFLCFSFIERVLKTDLAGANSRFMESNPLMRFRGQVLYASVLKKACPALLELKLDRGYRPKDLLTKGGAVRITLEYLKKRYSGKKRHINPGYLTLSLAENMNRFTDLQYDDDIFNGRYMNRMKAGGWVDDQMNFINMMSAAVFRNILDGGDACDKNVQKVPGQ